LLKPAFIFAISLARCLLRRHHYFDAASRFVLFFTLIFAFQMPLSEFSYAAVFDCLPLAADGFSSASFAASSASARSRYMQR
jgi:hypothetical protein